jgi:RimJ/RimL family protein N-acetyltransferase
MPTPDYLLRTSRLGFRQYHEGDVPALAEVFGDAYARQFYPVHGQHDKLQAWVTWSQRNYEEYGFGLWAIELLSTGEFVGDAGLTLQPVEGTKLLEIGYHIHPCLRGQGLATEAATACLKWAFDNTPHNTVCSIVHPENIASIHVAGKTHRSKRMFQGTTGPSLLFYTTREAYADGA